jgi:hypothetical protein
MSLIGAVLEGIFEGLFVEVLGPMIISNCTISRGRVRLVSLARQVIQQGLEERRSVRTGHGRRFHLCLDHRLGFVPL